MPRRAWSVVTATPAQRRALLDLERAQMRLEAACAAIHEEVRRASLAGIPMAHLASVTGMARSTLFRRRAP